MTSLSTKARIAGLLYILASAAGIVRLLYVPKVLFVTENAAATAGNIAAHEPLFRLGIACYLIGGVIWLFVPLALYRLLKDVDHGLAVLMVVLGSLLQVPAYIINTATDTAALLLARGDGFLMAFDKPQREALAMMFLRIHHQIDVADIVFAGLWLFPFGLLVYKSRFLPRLLGVWLMVACFAWVAFCLTGILFPGYEDRVFNYSQIFTLGEVATMLWLVIMGARERPQAVAA